MNKDLLHILSNSNKDIDNQKLMDYLSGKLPESEKHEVERWMADNEFANDAMEGLEQFENTRNMEQYVTDLHKDLGKYIQSKKSRREKRKLPDNSLAIIAIVLVVVLCVVGYFLVQKAK